MSGVKEKKMKVVNEMVKEAEMMAFASSDSHASVVNTSSLISSLGSSGASVVNPSVSVVNTSVSLKNLTWGPTLKYSGHKDWSGSVVGSYPKSIPKDRSAKFLHTGIHPSALSGSKGAVVYSGSNKEGGEDNCGWLFAWHVPGDGSPNKVFVKTGDLSQFKLNVIKWDEIQSSLDDSGDSADYADDNTRAEANAHIKSSSGNTKGAAGVLFDVNNG